MQSTSVRCYRSSIDYGGEMALDVLVHVFYCLCLGLTEALIVRVGELSGTFAIVRVTATSVGGSATHNRLSFPG